MTERKKISIRAYASLIGVDEKTVRKARDAGYLKDGYDQSSGKIIPHLADAAWGNTQKVAKPKAGVSRRKAMEKLMGMGYSKEHEEPEESEQDWLDKEEIRTGGLLAAIEVTSSLTAHEAMRRREIVALALDKKKLEEADGILIRRDAVEKNLFLLGSELKKGLLDIPARCARDIMACKNEVEAMKILTDEISLVLTTYGNLKTNSLTS